MTKFKHGDWVVGDCWATGKRLNGYYLAQYAGHPDRYVVQTGDTYTKDGQSALINVEYGDRKEELEFLISETIGALTDGASEVIQLKFQLQSAKENVEDQKKELAKLRAELKALRLSKQT